MYTLGDFPSEPHPYTFYVSLWTESLVNMSQVYKNYYRPFISCHIFSFFYIYINTFPSFPLYLYFSSSSCINVVIPYKQTRGPERPDVPAILKKHVTPVTWALDPGAPAPYLVIVGWSTLY